jgi:hypothetical protein
MAYILTDDDTVIYYFPFDRYGLIEGKICVPSRYMGLSHDIKGTPIVHIEIDGALFEPRNWRGWPNYMDDNIPPEYFEHSEITRKMLKRDVLDARKEYLKKDKEK